MGNPAADAKKNEGNAFFKAGKYPEAIAKYSEAIALNPAEHTFYSNRAAVYEKTLEWDKSAEDGKSCIMANKTFIKGYFRLALALKALKKYKDAEDALKSGLGVEPRNKDLKNHLSEVQDLMRKDKVIAISALAEEAFSKKDYKTAIDLCDKGLALGAGDPKLTALRAKTAPLFEKAEKMRTTGMSKTENAKEAGDKWYKAANFEKAIVEYTKCIDGLSDKSCALAIKALSNRSACYKQLSNFDGTIEDCSMVIEVEPDNVKALIRRAQGFEAVERYKFALQDVKTVLLLPGETVGAANWKIANEMQHRLNRVIQQLKN